MPLTVKQRSVMRFVRNYLFKYGYPPSNEEIAKVHSIRSAQNAGRILLRLQKKGLVRRLPGHGRAMRLCSSADDFGRLTTQIAHMVDEGHTPQQISDDMRVSVSLVYMAIRTYQRWMLPNERIASDDCVTT